MLRRVRIIRRTRGANGVIGEWMWKLLHNAYQILSGVPAAPIRATPTDFKQGPEFVEAGSEWDRRLRKAMVRA